MAVVTNAHTHLELTGLSSLCPSEPQKLVSWMNRVVRSIKELTKSQIQAAVEQGLRELRDCGTTHIIDVSASWQSLEILSSSDLKGVVCLEVRGLQRNLSMQRLEQAKEVINHFRRKNHSASIQAGLSLHAPYSCHPELLKNGAAWCKNENLPLCIHVSESPAETMLIQRARVQAFTGQTAVTAKLARLLSPFLPRWRPVAYLDSLGVLAASPILVHCIHLTNAEIRLIAASGSKVVHCPRSNQLLSCGRMPLERFLSAGIPVYLGTDSRASSPSLDIHEEAEFAKRIHRGVVDSDKIEAMIHAPFPSG